MKCPRCKGEGKVVITMNVQTHGEEGVEVSKIPMDCSDCDGSGELSAEDVEFNKAEAEMWCKCEGETDFKFHADGNRKVYNKLIRIPKHHYSCVECKKVKQIG